MPPQNFIKEIYLLAKFLLHLRKGQKQVLKVDAGFYGFEQAFRQFESLERISFFLALEKASQKDI